MKLKIVTLSLLGLASFILGVARRAKPPQPAPPQEPPPLGVRIPHINKRIARQAEAELRDWLAHSTSREERRTIETYWQTVSTAPWTGQPWSAAFVVFVTNKAAPGSLLKSASHWGYARVGLSTTKPGAYRTVDPQNHIIQVGDIIVRNREGGRFTFSDLERFEFQPSHGDIVTQVSFATALLDPLFKALAIGGNKVGGLVDSEEYPLNSSGELLSKAIAIMTLNPELPNV